MYETLRNVLQKDLHLTDTNLAPDATLEDAGLDSLALVELAMALEKKHGIDIPDEEMSAVSTVGEIANLMTRYGANAR
jgi:acyl carrier protein